MAAKGKAKTGGRTKGTPNKVSATAKENIIAVFTRLGGTAEMVKWARKNQTEFYKIYAKLLPIQLSGENGSAVPIAMSVEFVSTKKEE